MENRRAASNRSPLRVSRELSHRSVSILRRQFPTEGGEAEGEGGEREKDERRGGMIGEKKTADASVRRFNAKVSCHKDLPAAYFPARVRTFSISVERFFVPLSFPRGK